MRKRKRENERRYVVDPTNPPHTTNQCLKFLTGYKIFYILYVIPCVRYFNFDKLIVWFALYFVTINSNLFIEIKILNCKEYLVTCNIFYTINKRLTLTAFGWKELFTSSRCSLISFAESLSVKYKYIYIITICETIVKCISYMYAFVLQSFAQFVYYIFPKVLKFLSSLNCKLSGLLFYLRHY